MDWLRELAAKSSDLRILMSLTGGCAVLALALAALADKALFARYAKSFEAHARLADLVHSSLLAFSVFVLALVLSDVRSHFGKAEDASLREAAVVSRLDRELANLPNAEAQESRARLKAYVKTVAKSEWPSLAKADPELSPVAEQNLAALFKSVQSTVTATASAASTLHGLVDQLENARLGRFEAAEKTVPAVFWWAIVVFLVAAMIMNGRNKLGICSGSLITIHMAAIGLVMGLILILDAPFRGQTSVSAAAITRAAGLEPD
jgi:hypothetical protein